MRIDSAALVRGKYRPVAQRVSNPQQPYTLTNYARGPVGFLQWLAATQPAIYAGVREYYPQLLTQAHALTAQMDAGNLSGLGDWTELLSDFTKSATGAVSSLSTSYATIQNAKANLKQAAAGQQPLNSGGAPGIPPGSIAVSTPGIVKSTGMMIGIGAAAVLGALIFLKKKR